MRHNDDRYFDEEEDKDFWDDELELASGDADTDPDFLSRQPYDPDTGYTPYDADEGDRQQEDYYRDNNEGYVEEKPKEAHQDGEQDDYYSEPETTTSPRRERFFGKKDPEDVEEDNDYYDSDAEPASTHVSKPKAPKLDPEDPDYWIEEEESPLSGIIPGSDKKWKWQLGAATAIIALMLGAWIWFFRPYSDNAVKYGYIKNMERRGSVFKTFEGSMIPYKELGDPDPLFFQEVRFSVASDSLAAVMKRMMLGCVPVRVEYETYHSPLPWKGEQNMIIVKADTADPRKILPPEYRTMIND